MKWSETIASKCRYGHIAGRIFGDAEIIYEESEDDYQGQAFVLASMPDGTYATYAWSYGSCSGCDEWEYRELTEEQIETEMLRDTARFTSRKTLERFLHINDPWMEGYGDRHFTDMRLATMEWLQDHPEQKYRENN